MLVVGAMTAICDADKINVPADAACAPGGYTYETIGILEARMFSTIYLVESYAPPGVTRVIIINSLFSTLLCSILICIYLAVTLLITPFTSMILTFETS